MTTVIDSFVLQEFRLHAADTSGDVARIVAASAGGTEAAVPLLTSIDDQRDVAIVRAVHAGETAEGDPDQRARLDPFVESWQPSERYQPRITERAASAPSHYRLAVTGSGINNVEPAPLGRRPRARAENAVATPLDLLWTGVPQGKKGGLLVLLGDGEGAATRAEPLEWPLPMSRPLGIRIYESRD